MSGWCQFPVWLGLYAQASFRFSAVPGVTAGFGVAFLVDPLDGFFVVVVDGVDAAGLVFGAIAFWTISCIAV